MLAGTEVTCTLLAAAEAGELPGAPIGWVHEKWGAGRVQTAALGRYRFCDREASVALLQESGRDRGGFGPAGSGGPG